MLQIQNSQSSKAFLFDINSRLYVATDASPVDSATHNLCCDYLSMLNMFLPLYRLVNYDQELILYFCSSLFIDHLKAVPHGINNWLEVQSLHPLYRQAHPSRHHLRHQKPALQLRVTVSGPRLPVMVHLGSSTLPRLHRPARMETPPLIRISASKHHFPRHP